MLKTVTYNYLYYKKTFNLGLCGIYWVYEPINRYERILSSRICFDCCDSLIFRESIKSKVLQYSLKTFETNYLIHSDQLSAFKYGNGLIY